MKKNKRHQALYFIIAVILEPFIGQFALAQTYAVGIKDEFVKCNL